MNTKKARTAIQAIEKVDLSTAGVVIGKIVQVNESGQILVDYPQNPSGPVIARITALVHRELAGKENPAGREVLLAFVNNNIKQPVIVDAMYSLIDDIAAVADANTASIIERPTEALLDGKRVLLTADEEIVLQCGEANITLTKAGKVLISGEYISSNSRGTNKIKGGSIQLN